MWTDLWPLRLELHVLILMIAGSLSLRFDESTKGEIASKIRAKSPM